MRNDHDDEDDSEFTAIHSNGEAKNDDDDDDDDVVISGISGVFPSSSNLEELELNLRSKRNLISSTGEKRSTMGIGKIPNVEKFDAAYFGLRSDLADSMDPMGRLLLEKTYETIVDSGYNPHSFRAANVGVFVGVYLSETEAAFFGGGSPDGLTITGIGRCFLANRISYCFDFRGPSLCVDTACSSSMNALHLARQAIRNGDCDSAIVGGCNLCLNNGITLHLQKLGVVSTDGVARVLDEAGNGYCRAETVCTILLQKRKHARRIYATLIHTRVNCDGYKAEGVTYPSFVMQKRLLSDFYRECNVQPCAVDWLELHATGTRAGDREEIKSVSMFCENRASSLKVGSIRSNMGHAEAASTLCSIAKVIVAMRSGIIPPNINYTTPRNDIDALHNGSIQVITEDTPWDNGAAAAGLVGINSFGLGGANGHALLKSFEKSKTRANWSRRNHALPVLVAVSGRTRQAVHHFLAELERNPIDDEFVGLLHEIHSQDIVQHLYRGAIILDDGNATRPTTLAAAVATSATTEAAAQNTLFKEIAHSAIRQRPVWFVFSGVGSQWAGMAKRLMRLPIFADSIAQCDRILRPFNVNLIRIVSGDDATLLQDVVNCFVGITAVQIAFVDVLRALNVSAAGIIGHSAGEIACAYADNCLTRDQTILCAYYRGLSCVETQLPNGAMAAIGLGYDELKTELPDDVDIACRNSVSNCTISGPAHTVDQVVNKLRERKIFARRIDSLNMAFHSRYVNKVTPTLLRYLKKVIPEPRARSSKWISTSVCETSNQRNGGQVDDESKYCSALYMTNNMVSPVLFEQASRTIAPNAIVVEISPHSLLRTIIKQTCGTDHTYVALDVKQCPDSLQYFLQSVAKLFLSGETLKFHNLYPLVSYPVSKETRMIAPLVKWQHDRDWNVVFSKKEDTIPGERRYVYNAKIKELDYMFDHVIDGRNIVPGYIYLLPVWETVPLMYDRVLKDTSIVFENLRFQRMVNVYRDKPLNVLVHIQKGSGNFEIVENNQVVLSGRVYVPDDVESETLRLSVRELEEDIDMPLDRDDIYKEFQLRGYGYKNLFRQMLRSNFDGSRARVKWNENWITFLDTISQTYILQTDTRYPCLLTGIDKLVVDVDKHNAVLQQNLEYQDKGIPVYVDKKLGIIRAGGVQIRGVKGRIIPRRKPREEPRLLVYKFIPYANEDESDRATLFGLYARLMWDNIRVFSSNLKILEYECSYSKRVYYSANICRFLDNYPHMQVNVVVVCSTDDAAANNDPSEETADGRFTFVRDSRKQLYQQTETHLLIAEYDDQLQNKVRYLSEFGFLIIRFRYDDDDDEHEAESPTKPAWLESFASCCEHRFNGEKLIVYRRDAATLTEFICLEITPTFEWLNELKEASTNADDKRIVLYAQKDRITGLQGFFNCLAKEISCKNIKCFLILDEDAAPFSPDEPFYREQISKHLLVNVYKNRSWGCYAHLPIAQIASIKTPYAFVNVGVTGDLRTLNWYRGGVAVAIAAESSATRADCNRKYEDDNVETELIHVSYSALNFKDVLLATGVLSYEEFVPNRLLQECMIGCEFSGKNAQGKRYMGIHPAGAICTMLSASKQFLWRVPDEWSLEEAATVPIAYLTTIAAFLVRGNLKRGESVLIHSGAGGVGQAAINIAAYYECEIFTTVGTAEKKEFIKENFPHIKEDHIGRSRDCSFEQMVMTVTEGRGVDVVLNSLAEDKLLASVRCLAKGGRFLEIGKLDLLKDNPLGMNIFLRGVSFHCVLLDKIHEEKPEIRKEILSKYERELKRGSIKPIVRTVFEADELESAFRYLSSGKHIGKVLLKIRDDFDFDFDFNSESPPNILQKDAIPRFNCHSEKVYVICGGLGGMGLELADWLVLRGAKKLMLTSRKGVTNGYQKLRIKLWKSYGVTVAIRTDDVSKADHVRRLLQEAENLGSVDAIFNLAAVIDDRLLENQDPSAFEKTIAPKRTGTRLLDALGSEMCPRLEHFVVFSTLSCSYGNATQTNYAFANSCCERICEKRKERGLHALAVQWGAVDDVGMLTRIDMEKTCNLVGLVPQPIRSCLNTMDVFLTQTETIVSSFILGDKICDNNTRATDLLQTVANILGIKDTTSVSVYSPLPELGMDSISGLEVKQTLEQRYDLFLSPRELMSLTFASLEEIQKTGKKSSIAKKDDTNVMASVPYLRNALFDKTKQNLLLESTLLASLSSVSATLIPQSQSQSPSPSPSPSPSHRRIIFCFPPIDGTADALEPLSKNLPHRLLYCFQYVAIKNVVTVADQAEIFASHIVERLTANEPFNIIAYSYGVIIAMETLKMLQSKGATEGNVVLIDGSLKYAKVLKTLYFGGFDDVAHVQTKIIRDIASCFQPTINNEILENDLNRLDCWQAKLDYMTSKINSSSTADIETLLFVANYLYRSYTSTAEYHFETTQKFDTRLAIIRAKKMIVPMPADTGFNTYFARTPEEFYVEENHFSVLRSEKTAEIVQNFFEK